MDARCCIFCGIFSPSNEDCYCFLEAEEHNEGTEPHLDGFDNITYANMYTHYNPMYFSMEDFENSNPDAQQSVCQSEVFLSVKNDLSENAAHDISLNASPIKTESGNLVEFVKQSGSSKLTDGNEQRIFDSVIPSKATNFSGVSDFAFERARTRSDVNQIQKIKDHKKSQIASTKVTQVDHTRDEIVNNKDPLILVALEEAVSVAGPSEVHTQ
ncbi:hypothetical protein AVEN_228728-1, partial [Araneus ventricosus]